MSYTKNNPQTCYNIRNNRGIFENTTEKYILEMKSDRDNWAFLATKVYHSQNFDPSIIDTT